MKISSVFSRFSQWHRHFLWLLFAFCGLTRAEFVPDINNPQVVEAFVDGVVIPSMKEHHSPSGVVMIMKDNQIIFAKGYGFIDVQKRIAVDPYTSLFRPGSISKLFTWVSVMQQVEQGKLDLDTDVNQYLTQFKVKDSWPGQPVTLRHIMTHTAGFEDGGLGYLITDDPARIMPLAESLEKYQPARVNPPGEHIAYSNWATALAGLMVQNVSGVPFNQYVQQHIFDVLGMQSSTFDEPLPADLDKNMAKVYRYEADSYVPMKYEIVSNFGPAGALATTASDMSLFARAILNGGAWQGQRILQAATLDKMLNEGFSHDPRARAMGLGFLLRRFGPDGFDNFGHDGGTSAFASHFGMSKKENLMLFTSFSGIPGYHGPHYEFVRAFYDEFFPHPVKPITPPADFAERGQKYAGTYHTWRNNFTQLEALLGMFAGSKVAVMPDNTLMIGDSRYVEEAPNLFRKVDDYDRIAFQQDKDGNITGYMIDGLGVMQFYKAPFYETLGFNAPLLALCLLAFLLVVVRFIYQFSSYRACTGAEKNAWRASLAVAVSNFLFLITFLLGASVGMTQLLYGIPALLKFSLIFPILAVFASLWMLYACSNVWRLKLLKSSWARVRYSLVCALALYLVWFYSYWNVLGFQYFS
ncbi:serine hydrolase domain-containing protein [Neptunicella marina]|uniref:Serine hydrolase n=1 Tax=Neptunicella marina TaxID=2125989 RepID=A0A8J6M3S9_9ALTE|nr:serine hydrolase domain-containing protein [Neptunicella marina]MBC3765621.1 serine hydrolase [Neptunicella marina]